jgi:predicted MFS family arabinose efflux permease
LFLAQRVLQIALFTTMLTYGADSIPVEHRTQGLALFGLSGLLPIAVGGVIGDLVIEAFGYSALFVVAASASLSSWLLVWRLPLLPVLGHRPRRGFWHALAQRNLLPLWLATLALSIGMETIFTFTRTFVADRGVGSTGLFFGIYGVTAASMRIFGGRHYDRVPHRPLVSGALLAYGGGLLLLGVAGSALIVALAGFACGLSHGAVFPILTSEVVSRARTAERGSAMAIFTSIFDIALLVAAPAVGFMIDGFDYRLAFGVVSVVLAAGAVLYAWWDHRITTTKVAEVHA